MQMDERRAAFIRAAGELFQEKGIAKTSVGDIAKRVGVARSLFYHYFKDKSDITDAVIECRVNDFMQYVREWTSELNGENMYESIKMLVGVMRTQLLGPSSLGRRIVHEQDAGLYQRFVVRSSEMLAEHFVQTREERGSLIRFAHIRHPQESFYVLSVGIMSMTIRHSNVSDEVIADLILDTLHIDPSQIAREE